MNNKFGFKKFFLRLGENAGNFNIIKEKEF